MAAFDVAGVGEALPDSPDLSIIELVAQEQANQRHARCRAACTASGHPTAAPLSSVMNSRRCIPIAMRPSDGVMPAQWGDDSTL